jgi:two-component system, OmpR family, sensor kinase
MSIRIRLTLWYTGLLAISLVFFSLLLYSLLAGILLSVLDDRLAGQAQNVIRLIQSENDPLTTIRTGAVNLPPIDVFASQNYIQIVDLDGHPVQLSENLRGQRLPAPAGFASDIQAGRAGGFTASLSRGVRLRIYNMPIRLGSRVIGAIQVSQSLAALDDSLAIIRRLLLVGVLLSLFLASGGGFILARAVLRPIAAITDTAQRIAGTQDLGQRIPVAVPNDELGRLANTINAMLARLEVVFETQRRLVADVSHELRTPLTTIQGNVDLLRRGAVEDPGLRGEVLQAIGDETARMRRLVNDLLLLAQVDAGLQLHLQPVELDTLLLEVYRQAQVMVPPAPPSGMAQAITVRLGAEDQACVLGDSDRLRQLLLNLVDNALKYTPAGGEVTLTLRRSDGWVKVLVADNGIGIAPDDLPHIFERFYRADPSRGGHGGSGLGLSIGQWIAQAHGGRLEVESELGKGSTFTLSLPEVT